MSFLTAYFVTKHVTLDKVILSAHFKRQDSCGFTNQQLGQTDILTVSNKRKINNSWFLVTHCEHIIIGSLSLSA